MKTCLARRGIGDEDVCSICRREVESIVHALSDCPRVRAVGLQLGVKELNQVFWGSNLQDWLGINGKAGSRMSNGGVLWSVLFSFTVWLSWKSKN